nr:hypothetical protein [Tanacetum cinerariifolium]
MPDTSTSSSLAQPSPRFQE